MSFLFKSKQKSANPNALPPATRDIKSSDGPPSQIPTINGIAKPTSPTPSSPTVGGSLNSLSGSDNTVRPTPRASDERNALRGPAGPGEGTRGTDSPGLEQRTQMERHQEPPRQRLPMPVSRGSPASDPSPYPWSSQQLTFNTSQPLSNPFPRYGAAANATASKDGAIYLMGGLINGSTVKGDLWIVETGGGAMTCYPVATTSEGPGPRVGHASLLVGNAFIVFGGDTKMEETDMLDDTLYLLNTTSKQWSRALPAGPRPPGRYGHTLNILGSKIYIFGGQVEGYFFNDMYSFDLNALQQTTNRWELLIQNTIDGGPHHGQIPPARTNHTMVTWGDKMYLFGGTDGVHWFNDVWSYSPQTNSWTQLECIGYIPSPREGHSAALVGDVMYIFGGRTEDGFDLGDLAAFRITSRRWYAFQNMGSSPSARSGHSMTTIGKQIVVLAGEPSSAPRDPIELSFAYFLDTTKIRYPPDMTLQSPPSEKPPGQLTQRPSGEKLGYQPQYNRALGAADRERMGSDDSARMRTESRLPQATRQTQQLQATPGQPQGAPPQQQRTNGPMVAARQPTRPMSPGTEAERAQSFERNFGSSMDRSTPNVPESITPTSPAFPPNGMYYGNEQEKRDKVETYQPSQNAGGPVRSPSQGWRQLSGDATEHSNEAMAKVQELQSDEEMPQDSGIGSSPALLHQHDDLIKELEQAKQRNAWYASELALARKSGYHNRSVSETPPSLDEPGLEAFDENDRPLLQALLRMRTEVVRVQQAIDEQSKNAAERIAEMQSQRDAAINEAVYAKTRLASQTNPQLDSDSMRRSPDQERNNELSRRLASSLGAQTELSRRNDALVQELEAERRARQLAEETSEAAQRRVAQLEAHRHTSSAEIEGLRAGLHNAQREAREMSTNHAQLKSQHEMLIIDKDDLSSRLESSLAEAKNHNAVLISLKEALAASTAKADLLEQKLQRECTERNNLESQLRSLHLQHEERTMKLEDTSRRLHDAEEMAEKHANEARTHREAVMAGLGEISSRQPSMARIDDERVATLQRQVDSANALARQNQDAADAASEKLRRAEERIAGLEVFQEQASRESLSIRKQLQAVTKENQALISQRAELDQKMQSQMLETNALAVQHASLKDILAERGINASEVRRSRAMDSPNGSLSRFGTPDLLRLRELEQQLEASIKSHDEMRSRFEEVSERDEKMKREYEEKLTALDNDHQAAVKYLRGTEKMLSKMKQELQRTKGENGELRKKLDAIQEDKPSDSTSAEWETERESLKQQICAAQTSQSSIVSELEGRVATAKQQLESTEHELEQSRGAHATSKADLEALRTTHAHLKSDLERFQQDNSMLEQRARVAESKVQVLLDQVETSVDNYRRQSRNLADPHNASSGNGNGGVRSSSVSSGQSYLIGGGGGGGGGDGVGGGHSRNFSTNSATAGGDVASDAGRDSVALDMFATELESLRSQWETTNKNFRWSDRFDLDRIPLRSDGSGNIRGDRSSGALGNWRPGLGTTLDDDDDDDENDDHHRDESGDERETATPSAERRDTPTAIGR